MTDIREKPTIDHADVVALNFINTATPYLFRRHFRQGLRSHIMEVLDPADVERERTGVAVDGVRWFPKAVPRRMFRIFRSRFDNLDRALDEIGRVKLVERYLAPDFMATSTECIVDYGAPGGRDLLLCGFQEVVRGETLDPWTLLSARDLLVEMYRALVHPDPASRPARQAWIAALQKNGDRFVRRIKAMVNQAGHIPDLAGAGNLRVTDGAGIRLVDINNISPVHFDTTVHLDEKGYPVGDKSIEALALIEQKLIGRPINRDEPIYRWFLTPERCDVVKRRETQFWQTRPAIRA